MSQIETALRTALRANASLLAAAPGGVHNDLAPEAAHGQSVVIYSLMSAQDDYTMTPSERTEECRYLVKGVATTITAADAIADLIDTVMQTFLTVAGATVIDQVRVERVAYRDIDDGKDAWHRGGVWEISIDSAP